MILKRVFIALAISNVLILINATIKFTNLQCEIIDKEFVAISVCKLEIERRGVVSLNLHAKLLKGPVNNATVNIEIYYDINIFLISYLKLISVTFTIAEKS